MRLPFDEDFSFEEKDDFRTWGYSSKLWAEDEELEFGYWSVALDLVNAWATYQGKKKLLVNASHDETRHMVWGIIVDKYGGNLTNLERHKTELSIKVDETLYLFQKACVKAGVETVSREWLYRNLRDGKSYNSLRQKCRRRMQAGKPPQSLKKL